MYQIRKSMQNLQNRLSAASFRQRCVYILTLSVSGIMHIYSLLIYQHHFNIMVVLCNAYSGGDTLSTCNAIIMNNDPWARDPAPIS